MGVLLTDLYTPILLKGGGEDAISPPPPFLYTHYIPMVMSVVTTPVSGWM